jgi:multiple sugar transport system ATP-binding protein
MFVAGFIGSPQINFFDAELSKEGADYILNYNNKYKMKVPVARIPKDVDKYIGKIVVVGIRPEHLHDEEAYISSMPDSVVDANVDVTEMMGAETYLYLVIDGTPFTARVNPRTLAKPGDTIKICLDMNKIMLFDKDTENVIK